MKYEIADKLKMLRKSKGITQGQMADATGINRSTLANYEAGRRIPAVQELQKIADFFGVGLNYFGIATKEELFDILVRTKKVFASELISKDDKLELYQELMRLYIQLVDTPKGEQ